LRKTVKLKFWIRVFLNLFTLFHAYIMVKSLTHGSP